MKLYLIGFVKGLLLTLIVLTLLSLIDMYIKNYRVLIVLTIISSLGVSLYFMQKYKLSIIWSLLALVFSSLIFPFLLGHVEMKRPRKKAKR